jgi:glycosyltransferase involved in cell wall biosynthesis
VTQVRAGCGRTVVFVAPRFHTNQVGVVKALLTQGHAVVFHSLLRGRTEDYSVLSPEIIAEAGLSKMLRRLLGDRGTNRPNAFPNPFSYYRRLKQVRPDVVVVRDPSRAFSLVAAACARLLGARVVFYSQDFLRRRYSLPRRVATWLLLRLFSAAWYTPLLGAEDKDSPPRGRYFVPFVVERGETSRKDTGRTVVLMVGKYLERKNHLLLVEALAPIMAERDVDAVIVGEAATSEQHDRRNDVARRIEELGLKDRFTLLHNISFRDMPAIYQAADLFVLPASNEPAAVSVLEAIGFGIPAICSDSCGTRFYVEEGTTGAIFRSGVVEDLERVLRIWLTDDERLRRAHEECSRSAASFSGCAFYQHFKDMLHDRWPAEEHRW